jgi:hypothetical protein
MPVATVSKTYSLIQHRDVLASVFRALKMIHIDISVKSVYFASSLPIRSPVPGAGSSAANRAVSGLQANKQRIC